MPRNKQARASGRKVEQEEEKRALLQQEAVTPIAGSSSSSHLRDLSHASSSNVSDGRSLFNHAPSTHAHGTHQTGGSDGDGEEEEEEELQRFDSRDEDGSSTGERAAAHMRNMGQHFMSALPGMIGRPIAMQPSQLPAMGLTLPPAAAPCLVPGQLLCTQQQHHSKPQSS